MRPLYMVGYTSTRCTSRFHRRGVQSLNSRFQLQVTTLPSRVSGFQYFIPTSCTRRISLLSKFDGAFFIHSYSSNRSRLVLWGTRGRHSLCARSLVDLVVASLGTGSSINAALALARPSAEYYRFEECIICVAVGLSIWVYVGTSIVNEP